MICSDAVQMRNDVKSLLSSSISFESGVITCELEDTARERSANVKFEGRHERRPIEGGEPLGPHHRLVGD